MVTHNSHAYPQLKWGWDMTSRDAVLSAFDRLFDKAATKLGIDCDEQDKRDAKQAFAERFSVALDAVAQIQMTHIPEEVMTAMEDAIEHLSPAQMVGHLAAMPLARQAQDMLRAIAFRSAQQRLLEHLINQADDQYGGN
jgi:hypothetical protein